ncbi:MAG: peptide chain release factor N(5)-glutamine methyltransferase [Gemmatimonadota bacterium]
MAERTWRLLDLLGEASGYLASRGMEEPRLEAELLLAAALELRRLDLYLQFDRLLTPGEVAAFRDFVRQRLQGVPVQYVTGQAAFRLLDLEVTPQVLIPRPETEILVEEALAALAPLESPFVLDVGCGSGAIAISLAREHKGARVLATDLTPAALFLARANARRHGVDGRITFACLDLFTALRRAARFDAIVSNPPYVATPDLEGLAPEIRDHEPRQALDGGLDGLDFYRRIAVEAPALLRPGGRLLVEVGDGQAESVCALLDGTAGLGQVRVRQDLNHVPRVVTCATAEG